MRTMLDLLSEFVALNDAKVKEGGTLPPESERRWVELKEVYDVLMGKNGVSRGTVTHRFGAAEIRERVPRRKHLRVPVTMEIVFEHQGQYHIAKVLNLSCGGAFLASDTILEAGSPLTLYLANIGRGSDALTAIEGEVAWNRKAAESHLPQGMGIRFVKVSDTVQFRLDSFVLETLEMQLCGFSPALLDPEFLRRENVEL